MPGALSKLAHLDTSCVQYVHPWQENCTIAHAGLILQAAQYSLRTYSAVYLVSVRTFLKPPQGSGVSSRCGCKLYIYIYMCVACALCQGQSV